MGGGKKRKRQVGEKLSLTLKLMRERERTKQRKSAMMDERRKKGVKEQSG